MKNYLISEFLNPQGLLVCPVCGKEFKPNDDTQYIATGGFTCSWKCFMNDARRISAEKKERNEDKENKRSKNKTTIQFNFKT